MLTPLDIHNREFKKSLRGYDIDEVDQFLDDVIRDFEVLYKENLDLKETIQEKGMEIKRYKELENTLQNTLVFAQQTADEVQQNSKKEAELIVWEARKKAENALSGAQEEILETTRQLEKMQSLEKQLYFKIKHFLTTQLEYMEDYDPEKNVQNVDAFYKGQSMQED